MSVLHQHDDVLVRFAEACDRGDIGALRATLDADAVAVCDGGGLVPAVQAPVHGADEVARLAMVLLHGHPDAELTIEAVNGRAGLALRRDGRAIAVAGVQTTGTAVAFLWFVLNPVKLQGWHHR